MKKFLNELTLEKWNHWTDWPLSFLSIGFIVIYSWNILALPKGVWGSVAEWSMNTMWIIFAIDYVVSFSLAKEKWDWFKHHLFDFVAVVLPMIRPLRVLRVMTALNALHRTSGMALRGRIAIYVAACVLLLEFVGSLAILDAERFAPGATITSFSKALWWTFVSITTVGYGDYSPVTLTGRIIAMSIVLAGIALIGVVTATIASWIVDEVKIEEQRSSDVSREQLDAIDKKIDSVKKALNEHKAKTNNIKIINPPDDSEYAYVPIGTTASKLLDLKKLLDAGILTPEEYDARVTVLKTEL